MTAFRDIWSQMASGDLLTKEQILAKIHGTARVPEWDHGGADAVLVGLLQGGFFRMEPAGDGWLYRKAERLPEEPKGPADNGPGSEAYNAGLRRAHEEEVARMDREIAL